MMRATQSARFYLPSPGRCASDDKGFRTGIGHRGGFVLATGRSTYKFTSRIGHRAGLVRATTATKARQGPLQGLGTCGLAMRGGLTAIARALCVRHERKLDGLHPPSRRLCVRDLIRIVGPAGRQPSRGPGTCGMDVKTTTQRGATVRAMTLAFGVRSQASTRSRRRWVSSKQL